MKVSIIVPIYNVENYIEECLLSIVNQSFKDIEIICVNDFTMDNSMTIVKKIAKTDKRIKIVNNDKNRGLGGARNSGLDNASGDYIMFVDSDDRLTTNMVEKLYNKIISEQSDMVFCDVGLLNNDGTIYDCKPFHDNRIECLETFYPNENFENFTNMWPSAWNKIYKAEIIKSNKIRYYENILYEDHTFYYEYILKCKKVSHICESLYLYRHNRSDSIMKDVSPRIFEVFKILGYIEKIFNDNIDADLSKKLMTKISFRLLWERVLSCNKMTPTSKKFIKDSRRYLIKKYGKKNVLKNKDSFIDESTIFKTRHNNKFFCFLKKLLKIMALLKKILKLFFNAPKYLRKIKKVYHDFYTLFNYIADIKDKNYESKCSIYDCNSSLHDIKNTLNSQNSEINLRLNSLSNQFDMKLDSLNDKIEKDLISQNLEIEKISIFQNKILDLSKKYLFEYFFAGLKSDIYEVKSSEVDINYDLNDELKKMGSFYFIPNPGNLGDVCIAQAEYDFFNKLNLDYKIVNSENFISNADEKVRLVYGGGGIFTKYWYHDNFIEIFKSDKIEKCIILPSSFFECDTMLEKLDERFIVYCRDLFSFNYCKKINKRAIFKMANDMGFYLDINIDACSRNYLNNSIFSYKNHKEVFLDLIEKQYPQYKLVENNMKHILRTKTVEKNGLRIGYIFRNDEESSVSFKHENSIDLSLFSTSSCINTGAVKLLSELFVQAINTFDVIFTDRLHVGIVGTLLNKRVFLFDNSYHKTSGVYNMTMMKYPNVKLISELDDSIIYENIDKTAKMSFFEHNLTMQEFINKYVVTERFDTDIINAISQWGGLE